MIGLPRSRPTYVWLILIAATALAGYLAEHHRGVPWAALAVVTIAAVKIDLILQNFMELRSAPLAWSVVTRLWLLAVCGIVVAQYWL